MSAASPLISIAPRIPKKELVNAPGVRRTRSSTLRSAYVFIKSELTSVTDLGVSRRERLRPNAPSDGSLGRSDKSSTISETTKSSSSATSPSSSACACAGSNEAAVKAVIAVIREIVLVYI